MQQHTTKSEQIILKLLHEFRGMTALQIAQCISSKEQPKITQRSSIHNHLKRLKSKKLVSGKKIDSNTRTGSVYFLSSNGFNYVKDLLNIEFEKIGSGYTSKILGDSFSDLSYEVYKTPLEQLNHHLLFVDSLIAIKLNEQLKAIQTRNSIYASRLYFQQNGQRILRPDGEIEDLESGDTFFLEIDMGTENYNQLLAKFENYNEYFKTLSQSQLPMGIFFVTDSIKKAYGFNRRWMTVLSSFLSAIDAKFLESVNLIMIPIDDFSESLAFEVNKQNLYENYHNNIFSTQTQNKNKFLATIEHSHEYRDPNFYIYQIGKSNYQYVYISIAQQFESLVYGGYLNFVKLANSNPQNESTKNLSKLGYSQTIFRRNTSEHLPLNFAPEHIPNEILAVLQTIQDNAKIIILND
ncbi:replication-relaxation family protein [Solibacillus sp. CAU 1738]|uniref:replication-relaxation family protein n=1 Tax=Solibacillus sp. CAU 1738 TaxID=3140363 RepID=UPI0032616D6D